MNVRSINFKLIVGGCLAVLIPLVIVGYIATRKSSDALERISETNIHAAADDMSALITKILDEEKKLAAAFALDDLVRTVGEAVDNSSIDGAADEVQRLRKEMKKNTST